MMIKLVLVIICIICHVTTGANPVAQHIAVTMDPNSEVIITLLPFGDTSNITNVIISQFPSDGQLYQIGHNYKFYGYPPWAGDQITTAGINVTDDNHRVVFKSPTDFTGSRFAYKTVVEDGSVSSAGYVDIALSNGVFISSSFAENNDGWEIVAATAVPADWSQTSGGGFLNHYVYCGDIQLVVNQNNEVRWYFRAPSKYLGNRGNLLYGTFSFSIMSFAGDFSPASSYPQPLTFVYLFCGGCAGGAGKGFAQRDITYSGGKASFSWEISPAGGWLLDPYDDRQSNWPTPTECEMLEVLEGLTEIRIYGDFTLEYEAIGLDSFDLTLGSTRADVSCY